jgi:hypothetical protein
MLAKEPDESSPGVRFHELHGRDPFDSGDALFGPLWVSPKQVLGGQERAGCGYEGPGDTATRKAEVRTGERNTRDLQEKRKRVLTR